MDALSENLLLHMDVLCSNPFRQILTYSIIIHMGLQILYY